MADNPHDGHRKRVRERFIRAGLHAFQEHEKLEMLLFHAIPRADTNPIAHALLERFGSVHAVLTASPTALKAVPGMTENAVVMLLFLRKFYSEAEADRFMGCPLDSFVRSKAFFQHVYAFEERELVTAAFLDDKLCLIGCETLSEGSTTRVTVPEEQLSERAFALHSNTVILAHNHPKGTALPSKEDISVTRLIVPRLRRIQIELVDHIIIGEHDAVSLRERGVFMGLEE